MTTHRLRIGVHVADRLQAHHLAHGKRTETISLALGYAYLGDDGGLTVVLADPGALVLFDDDCYERRGHAHAVLRQDVRASVCWHAVQSGYTAIVDIHDHHFADHAVFSGVDDRDDRNSARYFGQTVPAFMSAGKVLHAAALVLAREDWAARVVHAPGVEFGTPMRVDRIGLEDRQLSAIVTDAAAPRFARQAAVLPPSVQARIGGLEVAIVGGGGTGSIAAEAFARLGFGRLSLIDADRLEETNLNRFQGGGPADLGHPKVAVLARHLGRIAPEVKVTAVQAAVFESSAVSALERADLIVGCVDNAETRWWLNRFAMQYAVPMFDCGVLVETQPQLRQHTRVSCIVPGAGPCGHCTPMEYFPRQRPTLFLDPITLAAQRSAGYVVETAVTMSDPSIYPLNLQAVSWLLQEVVAWVGATRPLAHSVRHRSDEPTIERTELQAYGGGGAADCPLCGESIGRCREVPLPSVGDALRAPVQLTSQEILHGQVQV